MRCLSHTKATVADIPHSFRDLCCAKVNENTFSFICSTNKSKAMGPTQVFPRYINDFCLFTTAGTCKSWQFCVVPLIAALVVTCCWTSDRRTTDESRRSSRSDCEAWGRGLRSMVTPSTGRGRGLIRTTPPHPESGKHCYANCLYSRLLLDIDYKYWRSSNI